MDSNPTIVIRQTLNSEKNIKTGDGGVLSITVAVWNAGFHWWRSGNKKRTQNVSEYMLVLALCLVPFVTKVADS